MNNQTFDYFSWVVLPLLIFLSRLADVTLATMRHIFVSKGFTKVVPFLGFIEVIIWLIAMRQVFSHLDNAACFIAWAAGFATGTYCGMMVEERLALGMQIIRFITDKDCTPLIGAFKQRQHGVTIVDAQGANGPVKIIFTVVKRVNKKEILDLIHQHQPDAFYSIEDVRGSSHGVFNDKREGNYARRMFSEKRK